MISAIVPVKSLPGSKSRLRDRFADSVVEALAAAMLQDVVTALLRVSALGRVVVVTPDATVADVAQRAGAETLLRDDPGLNAAIEAAAAELCSDPEDGVLVVLGDVAGIEAAEIAQLLAALDGPGVALAPSRDGGSSAVLRIPYDAIPAGFGPASAMRHRELADCAGVPFRELSLPSLDIDVDEPEDLEALLTSAAPAPHTRAAWLLFLQDEAGCRT
jgi:2-phospho-L-lactate guanylyltransferase